MLNKLLNNPGWLSLLAGASTFLAFEKFGLVPFIFLAPVFLNRLISHSSSMKQAFLFGFLTSFFIMLGGFYWVTYVLHEFGQLSWFLSGLLFLAFCGFGALNFPVFVSAAHGLFQRFEINRSRPSIQLVWFTLFLPGLFTLFEWAIPKLFPWYLGHSLYRNLLWIQICEVTGSAFLTFLIFSCGSTIGACLQKKRVIPLWSLLIPFSLTLVTLLFGGWSLYFRSFPHSKPLKVALVQANIGNLEKLAAKQGLLSSIQFTIEAYRSLSKESLSKSPDLIVWPETAIPFRMDFPGIRQQEVIQFVQQIGVPLISGAFSKGTDPNREFNAAFLITPQTTHSTLDHYHKNILLAFGEYLPLGEWFPQLYQFFPQVSDFERGTTQKVFTLSDGSRLGLSICYESIVPSFMRKVARQRIHAFINLTNDSWFGPTSEPYLHAALTVFRAVEHRVPLVRVTNTGTSFAVNHLGAMSDQTAIYQPQWAVQTVELPTTLTPTFFGAYGDWFIYALLILCSLSVIFFRRPYAAVSF